MTTSAAKTTTTRGTTLPPPSPTTSAPQRARTARDALALDLATVSVLWRRDLLRYVREKSRVIGALVQPLMFWFVIGSGMSSTFRLPGTSMSYPEYFYPGVIVMVLLFTSIFTTMSVIDDRHQGFLQSVIVGPGSRAALVVGKCLGASTIAVVQAGLFLLLAPAAGFHFAQVSWLSLSLALVVSSLGMTALGFAVAWWLDSTQGYHVVMSLLLLPMWILSGAMFPSAPHGGWIRAVMAANPMSYATGAVRRALYGGAVPPGTLHATSSPALDLGVGILFAALTITVAVGVCYRRR